MKQRIRWNPLTLCVGAGLIALILVGLLMLVVFGRRAFRSSISDRTDSTEKSEQAATVPNFDSYAPTQGGDALRGLGPAWTYIRQQENPKDHWLNISGLTVTRSSNVKLIGNDLSMELVEAQLEDGKTTEDVLSKFPRARYEGREGWLVSSNDREGFVLGGSSTVLIIRLNESNVWPTALPQDVMSYLRSVQVP